MALKDKLRELKDSEKVKPDKDVQDRIARGRARMKEGATKRNECLEFWRGNQYVHEGNDGKLASVPTKSGPNGKAPYRVRQVRNMIRDVVEQEVSAATQRVPSYSITPSTTDPKDISAARLAEKVAVFGHDKWRVRSVVERVVSWAVIADEGYAWPYFDNTVGDRISEDVATGELRIRVLGPNEVYWEPGQPFEDSRWHCVEQARPVYEVYAMQGFMGGKLTPDADASDVLSSKQTGSQLVLVTEYLERPCLKNPRGRRVILANGRQIVPESAYPLVDPKGRTVDEPVLHRLGYFVDPGSDRALGLVRDLLDPQRTINDCVNKQLEFKNLGLHPQILAPVGAFAPGTKITDEPGAVFEFNPVGAAVPQWRPTPQIPQELFQIQQAAKADIANIAAQNQIPGQVDSGKGIQALIEKDSQRRQRFIANLADFYSRLMRHCLYLVQRHYTEQRLLTIRGDFGPELIQDFMGAQLMNQADVTVFPGSIEPRTRESIEQKVMTFAQLQWISPEQAMAAINDGTAGDLIESYELDQARVDLIIQRVKASAEQMLTSSTMVTGPDGNETPDWMPREFDNVEVQKKRMSDWMKTTDYDALDAPQKEVANLFYQGLKKLGAQQQAESAAAQAATAQAMGNANAARPAAPPQLPSLAASR